MCLDYFRFIGFWPKCIYQAQFSWSLINLPCSFWLPLFAGVALTSSKRSAADNTTQAAKDDWDFRLFHHDAEWGWDWPTNFAHSIGATGGDGVRCAGATERWASGRRCTSINGAPWLIGSGKIPGKWLRFNLWFRGFQAFFPMETSWFTTSFFGA